MDTKGKSPGQESGHVSKAGNPTQTDSKGAMEQLLEKTHSLNVGTPFAPAENKTGNGNAKCKGAFAIAAAQDNWDLLEMKKLVETAKREWSGASGW